MRWELHRVWEVEATVAPGKRHAVPKRRFYIDEDSWTVSLVDGYDAQGKLWRVTQALPFVVPAIPAVVVKPVVIYNLQAKTYSMVQALTERPTKSSSVNRRTSSPATRWLRARHVEPAPVVPEAGYAPALSVDRRG